MHRPLDRRLGWTWWARKGSYMRFCLREVSAVFLFGEVVLIAILFHKAGQDATTYVEYTNFLWHPLMVALHFLALAFALWHTVTFFLLAPSALPPIRVVGRRVPSFIIVSQQFMGMFFVSLVIGSWIAWVVAT